MNRYSGSKYDPSRATNHILASISNASNWHIRTNLQALASLTGEAETSMLVFTELLSEEER